MQISYAANGSLVVKTKTESIVLGDGVRIGNHAITGPGEYDIATIQCDGKVLAGTFVFLLRSEELLITYATDLNKEISSLDTVSDTAILVLDVRSDADKTVAKSLIKAIEPAYVFLIGAGATQAFAAELGIPLLSETSFKITRTGLPLEGTSLIIPT